MNKTNYRDQNRKNALSLRSPGQHHPKHKTVKFLKGFPRLSIIEK